MAAYKREFERLTPGQIRDMCRELKQLIVEGVVVPQEPEPKREDPLPAGEEPER